MGAAAPALLPDLCFPVGEEGPALHRRASFSSVRPCSHWLSSGLLLAATVLPSTGDPRSIAADGSASIARQAVSGPASSQAPAAQASTAASKPEDRWHGLTLLACDGTNGVAVVRVRRDDPLLTVHEGDEIAGSAAWLVAVAPDRILVRAAAPDSLAAWVQLAPAGGESRILYLDRRGPPRAHEQPFALHLEGGAAKSRRVLVAPPTPTPHPR